MLSEDPLQQLAIANNHLGDAARLVEAIWEPCSTAGAETARRHIEAKKDELARAFVDTMAATCVLAMLLGNQGPTRTPPTQPGVYWVIIKGCTEWTIGSVDCLREPRVFLDGSEVSHRLSDFEWFCGPIAKPPKPTTSSITSEDP